MTSLITARVDKDKRMLAENIFKELGLTTSGAVNMFICAVARQGGLPFSMILTNQVAPASSKIATHSRSVKKQKQVKSPKLGLANGRYKFAPDFDTRFDEMDKEVAELFR